MKKIMITILTIVVLFGGILSIFKILYPSLEEEQIKTTTTKRVETELGYVIVDNEKNFQSYLINRNIEDNFSIKVKDNEIKYNNKEIFINEKSMIKNVTIINKFVLYSNTRLVLLFNYIDSPFSGMIFYNMIDQSFKVIDSLDSKYISFKNNLYFENIGIIFDLTIVDDKYIYLNDKKYEICKFEYSKETPVIENVEYFFDFNLKEFATYEVVSSLNYGSYKATNKICK